MTVCNWDPKKHNGKPCPIHGSDAVEGREERKNRRQELKENEDSFRDNKYSYSTARDKEDEINEKYGKKSSEKYNIGSNKKLTGEERQKMQDLVDAFNEAGIKTELVDGWEDYGAKMEWTAPVIDDTWALNHRQWIDYMNGKESIQDIVEDYAEKYNIDIDEGVLESFDEDYDFDKWDMPERDMPKSDELIEKENYDIDEKEKENIKRDSKLGALKDKLNSKYISISTDILRSLSDEDIEELNAILDDLEDVLKRNKR